MRPSSDGYAEGECTPTELLPALTSLGNDFEVPAGYPVGLQVVTRDNCGQPLESGSVAVEFSNGDRPLSLQPLRQGRWDGTWQTRAQTRGLTLKVIARTRDGSLRGERTVSGNLGAGRERPLVREDGVVSTASLEPQVPLAPGALITVFGERLAETRDAVESLGVPWDVELAQASVWMADCQLPLQQASDGRVVAQVPYGITANTRHQVLVQRGPTYAQPVYVNMAAAQPAVFTTDGKWGRIRTEDGRLVGPDNPVKAGDRITIDCAGLGEVESEMAAGSAPDSPLKTKEAVTVRFGEIEVPAEEAALVSGEVGLYRVRVVVPEGVTSSDQVELRISMAGQTSPPVVTGVH